MDIAIIAPHVVNGHLWARMHMPQWLGMVPNGFALGLGDRLGLGLGLGLLNRTPLL